MATAYGADKKNKNSGNAMVSRSAAFENIARSQSGELARVGDRLALQFRTQLEHQAALKLYGPSPIHRKSFEGVDEAMLLFGRDGDDGGPAR